MQEELAESVPERSLKSAGSVGEVWVDVWTLNFPEAPQSAWGTQPRWRPARKPGVRVLGLDFKARAAASRAGTRCEF